LWWCSGGGDGANLPICDCHQPYPEIHCYPSFQYLICMAAKSKVHSRMIEDNKNDNAQQKKGQQVRKGLIDQTAF
jgi:hypothetical protein